MLFEVKERLEGIKYNIDFGGRGGGTQGKGIGMSTMQKGAILKNCLNTFVPYCSFHIGQVESHAVFRREMLVLWIDSITYMFTRATSNISLILFERGIFFYLHSNNCTIKASHT